MELRIKYAGKLIIGHKDICSYFWKCLDNTLQSYLYVSRFKLNLHIWHQTDTEIAEAQPIFK